ncbi:unnamed protein product [Rotaria sp. Silwood2]|nr:unnamed protein product [Rotaria sp. Silwood2]
MALTFIAFAYIVALTLTALLIFFAICLIIIFDELKVDDKDLIKQCKTLNLLIMLECMTHIFINFLFVISGEWLTVFFNLPLVLYHINKQCRHLLGEFGIYEARRIMISEIFNLAQREGWIRLSFYMITFFYYIYCIIAELIRK